jgi:hypothetical protein
LTARLNAEYGISRDGPFAVTLPAPSRIFVTQLSSAPWRIALALSIACCATLISARRCERLSDLQRSPNLPIARLKTTSILAGVAKDLGQPWVCIDSRLMHGKSFSVKRLSSEGGPVRLVVSDFSGLSGDTIDIDLWKLNEEQPGKPWIEASIVWTQDIRPFETSWDDVSGQVWISSMDWSSEAPVVVHFDLHGMRNGKPHTASGEVTLPR